MWYEMTRETCPYRGFVRFDNLEKCKKVIMRLRPSKGGGEEKVDAHMNSILKNKLTLLNACSVATSLAQLPHIV